MKKNINKKKIKKSATKTKKITKGKKAAVILKEKAPEVVVPRNEEIVANVERGEDVLFSMETYDHILNDNERSTFGVGFIVSVLSALWFVYQRNITATLVFILMAMVVWMFLRREPQKIVIKMDKTHFWFSDEKYNVFDLEYFWFKEKEGMRYLNIKIKRPIVPVVTVILGDVDLNEIRKAFLNFIPELSPEEIEKGILDTYQEEKTETENDKT